MTCPDAPTGSITPACLKCKEKGGVAEVWVRAWSLAGVGEDRLQGAWCNRDRRHGQTHLPLNHPGVPDETVMVRDILSVWDTPADVGETHISLWGGQDLDVIGEYAPDRLVFKDASRPVVNQFAPVRQRRSRLARPGP